MGQGRREGRSEMQEDGEEDKERRGGMMDDEDEKRTTRTRRQGDDEEDKIFSGDLPFAPSRLRHRGARPDLLPGSATADPGEVPLSSVQYGALPLLSANTDTW